jgi:beta-glucanase (GH16 family)
MRISARIKMPNVTGNAAAGYWPAFWSLGNKYRGNYQNWPMVGEFDIMEVNHCGLNRGSDKY